MRAGGGVDPDRAAAGWGDALDDPDRWPRRSGWARTRVAQIWADHELKPWRVDVFKLSNDPEFEEKLVDVVGLYLKPPARAVVFSFDEKTQCQALDRTQPSLPMKPGRAGTMTHDYKRHGTIDLFAAMNVGTGQVHTHLRKGHAGAGRAGVLQTDRRHRAQRGLVGARDPGQPVRAQGPEIRSWLAHKDRRRWHLHFTPTSSSWLNLVERWFKELTDKRLRRGVFTSVADLTEAITVWAEHWNSDPQPFIWKATAEDIIEKVSRGRETLHQIKSRRTTSGFPRRRRGSRRGRCPVPPRAAGVDRRGCGRAGWWRPAPPRPSSRSGRRP